MLMMKINVNRLRIEEKYYVRPHQKGVRAREDVRNNEKKSPKLIVKVLIRAADF